MSRASLRYVLSTLGSDPLLAEDVKRVPVATKKRQGVARRNRQRDLREGRCSSAWIEIARRHVEHCNKQTFGHPLRGRLIGVNASRTGHESSARDPRASLTATVSGFASSLAERAIGSG